MQELVNELITAAEQTGKFATIKDELLDETRHFPVLSVGDRRAPSRRLSEDNQLYEKIWTYEVFILINKSKKFIELEILVNAYLDKVLTGPYWKLEDEYHYESTMMGRDVLAARLLLSNLRKIQYG